MVLVDAVLDLASPNRTTTNLGFAPVSLHHEKIASLKPKSFKFIPKQFYAMNLSQFESIPMHVGNSEKRE